MSVVFTRTTTSPAMRPAAAATEPGSTKVMSAPPSSPSAARSVGRRSRKPAPKAWPETPVTWIGALAWGSSTTTVVRSSSEARR